MGYLDHDRRVTTVQNYIKILGTGNRLLTLFHASNLAVGTYQQCPQIILLSNQGKTADYQSS